MPARLRPPEKTAILDMPEFKALSLDAVSVPRNCAELEAAWDALGSQPFIGFDTESRPCFTAGQPQRGPDVVQFATAERAFVLQMSSPASRELACQLLRASVVKVGFGVLQDQPALKHLLAQLARPLLDMDEVFRRRGYNASLGIKAAVAVVFGQRFIKSKRVTTSNWSSRQLEPKQLLYAGNDAHVALRVLQALNLPKAQLPIWEEGHPPVPSVPR